MNDKLFTDLEWGFCPKALLEEIKKIITQENHTLTEPQHKLTTL